jgi:hypothetical protein
VTSVAWDTEHATDDEREALAFVQGLIDRSLVEALPDGFRLHLLVPIKAFPDKKESPLIDSLRFRLASIGDLMDYDSGTASDVLSFVASLCGHSTAVLRQLSPKDYAHAQRVAYLPLSGPPFRLTGGNGAAP